jgi:hypothetical protein
MDVRGERGYWSHEEARWINYRGDDVDVAAAEADEPATGTHAGGDRADAAAAERVPDVPDAKRANTLSP